MAQTTREDLKLLQTLRENAVTHPFSYLHAHGRAPFAHPPGSYETTMTCSGILFQFKTEKALAQFFLDIAEGVR